MGQAALEQARDLAIRIVTEAAVVCRVIQREMVTADSLEKRDKSPVTVADFTSQAIVSARLIEKAQGEPLVAEEDAESLRRGEQAALSEGVRRRVAQTVTRGDPDGLDLETVLNWIDRGATDPPIHAGHAWWTLDPIDGTKGFLRGDQYAIALARLRGGELEVAAMACPNLPWHETTAEDGTVARGEGVVFAATRGGGAVALKLGDVEINPRPVRVSDRGDAASWRFCESFESGHSDQSGSAAIAEALGIHAAPARLDSQAKYGLVARGDAEIYLRLPTRADYQEKIWDHAAGSLIVTEAGGRVTDVFGTPLDFSQGRTLATNTGVIATHGPGHDALLEALADRFG